MYASYLSLQFISASSGTNARKVTIQHGVVAEAEQQTADMVDDPAGGCPCDLVVYAKEGTESDMASIRCEADCTKDCDASSKGGRSLPKHGENARKVTIQQGVMTETDPQRAEMVNEAVGGCPCDLVVYAKEGTESDMPSIRCEANCTEDCDASSKGGNSFSKHGENARKVTIQRGIMTEMDPQRADMVYDATGGCPCDLVVYTKEGTESNMPPVRCGANCTEDCGASSKEVKGVPKRREYARKKTIQRGIMTEEEKAENMMDDAKYQACPCDLKIYVKEGTEGERPPLRCEVSCSEDCGGGGRSSSAPKGGRGRAKCGENAIYLNRRSLSVTGHAYLVKYQPENEPFASFLTSFNQFFCLNPDLFSFRRLTRSLGNLLESAN